MFFNLKDCETLCQTIQIHNCTKKKEKNNQRSTLVEGSIIKCTDLIEINERKNIIPY